MDCNFVIDTPYYGCNTRQRYCDCCCVDKRHERRILYLNRIVGLRNEFACFRFNLLHYLPGNVRILLPVSTPEPAETVAQFAPHQARKRKNRLLQGHNTFVEGDFVACRRCTLEKLRRFRCALRIGVFGYDNFRNRRCIFQPYRLRRFRLRRLRELSVPQPLNADCAIVVHFQRCADSKQRAARFSRRVAIGQPTVQRDVGNVRLHIAGQR